MVHELLGTGELRERVTERLGPEVVVDGKLDRARIAARVFADDEARAWLEGELWPRVGMRVADWRAGIDDDRVGVVEVPLLFESGMEAVFDATIAVVADEELRAAARRRPLSRRTRGPRAPPARPVGKGAASGLRSP